MSDSVLPVPLPVPSALQLWIALNVDFQVLLCIHPTCHRAVSPSSLSQHLRRKHRAPLKLRQQVDSYVGQFLQISANYDFRTVLLLLGGGLLLLILLVINGYQC